MQHHQFKLGSKLRDKVTGLTGIATAVTYHLYGCERFYLQPPVDKDGKQRDGLYCDAPQLELLHESGLEETKNSETGGPKNNEVSPKADMP